MNRILSFDVFLFRCSSAEYIRMHQIAFRCTQIDLNTSKEVGLKEKPYGDAVTRYGMYFDAPKCISMHPNAFGAEMHLGCVIFRPPKCIWFKFGPEMHLGRDEMHSGFG